MSEKISEFPNHLFVPSQAESLNFFKTCIINPSNDEQLLMSVTALEGQFFRFISYGVFTDAQFAENVEFIPRINGRRILRLHGSPQPDHTYKIVSGLGGDLSNACMVQCDLSLKPHQTLTWHVLNKAGVDTPMGVRMVGYEDSLTARRVGYFR